MNLAILHYHLNRGGVTRVVANQLLALDKVLGPAESCRVALIYGGRREGWSEALSQRLHAVQLTLHEVPLLDYDAVHRQTGPQLPERLYGELAGVLRQLGFTPGNSLFHIHNHSLGKNNALPEVVARLAGDGHALLLQIHDFAEDFRPNNYQRICRNRLPKPWGSWPEALYPQGKHIHYAVLNGRDHAVLTEAGVPPERLHLLSNPVTSVDQLPDREQARRRLAERFHIAGGDRYVLYPVRCIRRKNLGEVLLLSALAPERTFWGLTLAPRNPVEKPVYRAWKQLASDLRLPCRFEVGGPQGLSFAENLAAADLIVTTSLAEGFGMVYLETWLAGLRLIGRDLPEITSDYVAAGVRFDGLLPQLRVPLQWVGAERFSQALIRSYRRTLESYGRRETQDLNDAIREKTQDNQVDFGDLDEPLQRQVIRAACRSKANRRRLFDGNPGLESMLTGKAERADETIRHNAAVVASQFSLAASGRRLGDVYGRLLGTGPHGRDLVPLSHPDRILNYFLDLKRFRMIRG